MLVMALLATGALLVGMVTLSWLSRRTPELGLVEGRLLPCPTTANAVCSLEAHDPGVAPLRFSDTPEQAWQRLRTLIESTPRTRILEDTGHYMRVEVRSRVWRFVDDLEFALDAPSGIIHARGASRVGRYDFGVNLERLTALSASFGAGD